MDKTRGKRERKSVDESFSPVVSVETFESKQDESSKESQEPKAKKQKTEKPENKYKRGHRTRLKEIRSTKIRNELYGIERKNRYAVKQTAQADLLLTEEAGFLEPEGDEKTYEITQKDLLPHLDMQTRAKVFDLLLPQLGPYKIDYTRNGRYLLLCGNKGHIAMIDWEKKSLVRELHLNEACRDIKFLQDHTFFAVAQKRHGYIYDKNGVEVHHLPKFSRIQALDFLPHHFLLVGINDVGILQYQDTSTGRDVATHRTKRPGNVLRHNPYNAVTLLGQRDGVVSMWTPNLSEAAVKMFCHPAKLTALCADPSGKYLVTTAEDKKMKVWDLRTYKELYSYNLPRNSRSLDISQRGIVSVGCGDFARFYRNIFTEQQEEPYMQHFVSGNMIEQIRFCPFEDVVGVGHANGFSSIIIPGSGEPNIDSNAGNPFQSKQQRREAEVHALLDKIQPEMIQLDPTKIGTLDENVAARSEETRHNREKTEEDKKSRKKKEYSAKTKQTLVWKKNRELTKERVEKEASEQRAPKKKAPPSALNRFSSQF